MSESADAQILAARADAALLLVRRHHTRVDALKAAMQNLTESGVHMVGSVINNL
jgi:Mrp family chromosome partitioning ATPase